MDGKPNSAATAGPITIEVTPENSACTFGYPAPRNPHPRDGEREALRRLRATRKARAKAARKTRRRQRLRRS